MLTQLHRKTLAASLTLLLGGFAGTSIALDARPAVDMGTTTAMQTVNVTLVLKLHDQQALEDYAYRTVTPADPLYHHFLTTDQFAARFGASTGEIARVQAFLKRQGITQTEVLPDHLAIKASGTIGQFSKAFQTSVHEYQSSEGKRFRRPSRELVIPAELADTLVVASGLSNEAKYHPHNIKADFLPSAKMTPKALARTAGGNGTATGQPGNYTVGDVANLYNINSLYAAGVTGKGSTVGVVTLADFYPSDAYAYWNLIGLVTKPNRITQVHVDGGGPLSGPAGSGETSLDVEQSGGLAPFANVIVYDAPDTDAGFIDVFYKAVSDNIADSISVSWGEPEVFYYNTPIDGGVDNTGQLRAFHQVFLEAAVQGQSMFAASGDSGAYDTVRALGFSVFSAPLTVDAPSSDPFITAAGGTTVPVNYGSELGGPDAFITQESVWGWDYLQNYLDINAPTPGGWHQYLFSAGGGGGVSVFWRKPPYQFGTNGIRRTESNQSLDYLGGATPQTILKLPAKFAGRNLPDISLNADPFSGYSLVSTTDGGFSNGWGGTSFVAPQLNGITALLRQSTGHRIGLWNPQVYFLQNLFGYGPWSAFKDIRAGDNWFYQGIPGYEPGAGIGALNVTNLDLFLRSGF